MNVQERFDLIARNTQQIVEEKELRELLKKKKNPTAYVGYATTGLMHVGHLVPLVKIGDFLKASFKFIFLTADIHGYLDNAKDGWEPIAARAKVYEELVKAAIKSIGVDPKNLKFVKGSDFQLTKDYILDTLILSGKVPLARAKHAASEVVKLGDNPRVSGFIYPLMQTLDIKHLKVDVAYGGNDQRSIYMMSREFMPLIGESKPICIFSPLISGLAGGHRGAKMSASEKQGKISLLDSPKEVVQKLNAAFCPAREIERNGVLELLRLAIYPVVESKGKKFVVERPEKFGGTVTFGNYSQFEQAYADGQIHPADLKAAVAKYLNEILAPIRKKFSAPTMRKLLKKAYP